MTGFLASQGVRVGTKRVGESLARVNPYYHQKRVTRTERQTNPIPYTAKYFGHKVHIDQNEKLILFGVTHVCVVDEYEQNGGRLTDPYQVGADPLNGNTRMSQLRSQVFSEKFPSFNDIFSRLVNGDRSSFQLALKFYIDTTNRIASTL